MIRSGLRITNRKQDRECGDPYNPRYGYAGSPVRWKSLSIPTFADAYLDGNQTCKNLRPFERINDTLLTREEKDESVRYHGCYCANDESLG